MNKQKLISLVGWYGVVAILAGYFLVSFSFITAASAVFQTLNLTGAIGIVIVSYAKQNYQPVVLNIVWALIAFVALLSILR